VATRTFNELVYGEARRSPRRPTEAITNGITRDDLVAWHRKYWGSNNAILVVAGDFKKARC
jgi:predicted Zn-dependent peptidase